MKAFFFKIDVTHIDHPFSLPSLFVKAALLKDLTIHQSAYSALRSAKLDHPSDESNESALQQQTDKLRDEYQRVYYNASDELRHLSDALSAIKTILKRRDRRASGSMMDIDSSSAAHDHDGYSNHHAVAMDDCGPPVDRLDIWYHDASNLLPIGSEVAALVDQHSIPPLWIQSTIVGYRLGEVRT